MEDQEVQETEGSGDKDVKMSQEQFDTFMETVREAAKPSKADVEAAKDEVAPKEERSTPDVASHVKVKDSAAAGERALLSLTGDMYRAIYAGNEHKLIGSQKRLFEGGHYEGNPAFDGVTRDGFNTLVEDEGGVFLPTTISQRIFDIEKEYGLVPSQALQLPIPRGREKLPNVSGNLQFFAVAEGSEMKARKFSFGFITLQPLEWGVIVPWTNKMDRQAGERLVPIINRKLAEASAKVKDDTFINGDGTASYHNITGLLNRTGDVNIYTSSQTTTGALDADDWLDLKESLPPSVRDAGVYFAHHDRRTELNKLKNSNGDYILQGPGTNDDGLDRLWGRPIVWTEAAPQSPGTGEAVAGYFHPDYLAYGVGSSLMATTLSEATIRDVDDSTLIRLAAQNQRAMRIIEEFDLELGEEDAFAYMKLS